MIRVWWRDRRERRLLVLLDEVEEHRAQLNAAVLRVVRMF